MDTISKLLGYTPEKMAGDTKIVAMKIVDNAEERYGDIVIARRQADFTDGDLALICVYGMGHICRKIKCHTDGIELIATNNSYSTIHLSNEDIATGKAFMIGKVIELRATL